MRALDLAVLKNQQQREAKRAEAQAKAEAEARQRRELQDYIKRQCTINAQEGRHK